MKRARHEGEAGATCVACITLAEQRRMPWQASYLDVLASGAGDAIREKHSATTKRAAKRSSNN